MLKPYNLKFKNINNTEAKKAGKKYRSNIPVTKRKVP
jgi:hypothetical protein